MNALGSLGDDIERQAERTGRSACENAAELRDELTTFCARTNLEFDAVVCYEMKRWLLAQTITLLEGAGEGEEGRPFKPRL
jgi:hypothetical protein